MTEPHALTDGRIVDVDTLSAISIQWICAATTTEGQQRRWTPEPSVLLEGAEEAAELFAVLLAHVNELDAGAVGQDVADDGHGADGAEAAFEFHGECVADLELAVGGEAGATETDG